MEPDPIKLDYATPAKKAVPPNVQAAAMLLVIVAVLAQVFQVGADKEVQTFWGNIHNGTTAEFTRAWKDHGDLLKEIAPSGNVAILYRGFDPNNSGHVTYAAQSHFLGEYQIFPRRVFTADETTVINKGTDVINPAFAPSIEWLQRNGVLIVATYQMAGQNQLQVSTAQVPPVSPSQGGH